MRFVLFYHSLISDWNHGNAHFLRGVAAELVARGHDVRLYEPDDSWSVQNLVAERGPAAVDAFHHAFPGLRSTRYRLGTLDLDEVLSGADIVIAHEWNALPLLAALTAHRARGGRYRLLFHDTHHRAVSQPDALAQFPIQGFDDVLAFGASLREQYQRMGWGRRVWVWHEAADTRVFKPLASDHIDGDLIWIGNWGDDERTAELREFLIEPVRTLGIRARVHGVRYPDAARQELAAAGIHYGAWIPNYEVPAAFSRFHLTVHVPRRPYVQMLPGIPTIRPFEALACGIPLVSAPWFDAERLFRGGEDYLQVEHGAAMAGAIRELLNDAPRRAALAASGLRTILDRHTCAHRVDELLSIVRPDQSAASETNKAVERPRNSQRPALRNGTAPTPP